MVEGVLESEYNGLGLSLKNFKECKEYLLIESQAKEIAVIMNNLDLVQEFKDCLEYLQQTYDGSSFVGPSGHEYFISKTEFRKSFFLYLQFFKFSLLAQVTINTLKKFNDSKLLYHFHDGNRVAVKKDKAEAFFKKLSFQIENTDKKLILNFTPRIEIKSTYLCF